jgi:SET domain-containing protein
MVAKDDWRLTNQERYLKGVALYRRQYEPANEENDHDHCEFCFTKFMRAAAPDALHDGYTTQDRYRWICHSCFDDFRDMFGWTVAP